MAGWNAGRAWGRQPKGPRLAGGPKRILDAATLVRAASVLPGRRGLSLLFTGAATSTANAVETPGTGPSHLATSVGAMMGHIDPSGVVSIGLFLGIVTFATVTSLLYIRERNRWIRREAAYIVEVDRLQSEADRAELLMAADSQILVAWNRPDQDPLIEGDITRITGAQTARRVLAFGTWLPPDQAQAIERAIAALKSNGDPFRMTLRTAAGLYVDVEGRAVAGRALTRIRDVGEERALRLRAEERSMALQSELSTLKTMLDQLPQPAWLRDRERRLSWVNKAYAAAVEAASPAEAVERDIELLERRQREDAIAVLAEGRIYVARVPAVVAGKRASLDVVEVAAANGSGGLANDVSELEAVRADLERQMRSHAATLDQLATGVAIFDASQRLVFHNPSYRQLWNLDAGYLESRPKDGEILDLLRVERRLPEQADFKVWKAARLEVYSALTAREEWWYLPDGRTIRVVANPNPQGGVTYLFDDVSERFHLESRYNALMRVQGETLDSLKEGVAVFASDGRLKLFNPAFASLWKLPPDLMRLQPHVDEVVRLARILAPDEPFWDEIAGNVAGLGEQRTGGTGRIARRDGTVLECAIAPLPDGATLVTFADVTASVDVERALTERNEALEQAARLRDDFMHHVSYELRSPLTTIIGFTQLLADGTIGPLNERQQEYSGHILRSSAALMAIINDILDLTSIDQGALDLVLAPVDLKETIGAVVDGVQDRLAEASIALEVAVDPGIGSFLADGKRLRQILFNLLSNAIGFSSPGQVVELSAHRRNDEIALVVRDHGQGIPDEIKEKVFDRFETHTLGSGHRGVGLGLSIVRAFVELHGGRVFIESQQGEGTTVTCILPFHAVPPADVVAA